MGSDLAGSIKVLARYSQRRTEVEEEHGILSARRHSAIVILTKYLEAPTLLIRG